MNRMIILLHIHRGVPFSIFPLHFPPERYIVWFKDPINILLSSHFKSLFQYYNRTKFLPAKTAPDRHILPPTTEGRFKIPFQHFFLRGSSNIVAGTVKTNFVRGLVGMAYFHRVYVLPLLAPLHPLLL